MLKIRINKIFKYLKLYDYYIKGNQIENYDDKRRLEILIINGFLDVIFLQIVCLINGICVSDMFEFMNVIMENGDFILSEHFLNIHFHIIQKIKI